MDNAIIQGTETNRRRFDVLALLGRAGLTSLRMKFFGGGLTYTAGAVALTYLVVNQSMLTAIRSQAQSQQFVDELTTANLLVVPAVFVFLGVLVFFLSRNVSDSIESSMSEQIASMASLGPSSEPDHTAGLSARLEEVAHHDALLSSALNSLPQAVFCKDLDGRYTFANRQFCARMRLPLDGVIGKTDSDLFSSDEAA